MDNLQTEIDRYCENIGNYYPTSTDYDLFRYNMRQKGHTDEEITDAIAHYES